MLLKIKVGTDLITRTKSVLLDNVASSVNPLTSDEKSL